MPPSIAASHESIPHRQARRVWNIPENHTWPLGAGPLADSTSTRRLRSAALRLTTHTTPTGGGGTIPAGASGCKSRGSPHHIPTSPGRVLLCFLAARRTHRLPQDAYPVPTIAHFLRATNRARVPMEIDELDANVIVVDDDLQAEWLKLVPGQQAHLPDYLPEAAPWQGLSIVCCTQENGPTADGDRMVTVWWLKMETTSPGPPAVAADLWSPLRVPGPTSGADPGSMDSLRCCAPFSPLPQGAS